jgi:hypothetical protein
VEESSSAGRRFTVLHSWCRRRRRRRIGDLGTETSLNAKLDAALAALEAGNTTDACGSLGAMIDQITAPIGKKISAADAAALIADVDRMRAVIGC